LTLLLVRNVPRGSSKEKGPTRETTNWLALGPIHQAPLTKQGVVLRGKTIKAETPSGIHNVPIAFEILGTDTPNPINDIHQQGCEARLSLP
jgi:hypothetical protein